MEDKAAITRVSKAEETLAIVLGNRRECYKTNNGLMYHLL